MTYQRRLQWVMESYVASNQATNASTACQSTVMTMALIVPTFITRDPTYLRKRRGRPARILRDLDGTDDPTHGEQEGSAYHGYFRHQAASGETVRLAGEAAYQAESWPHPRRVVFKAEALAKGSNTRFGVTSRTDEPIEVNDRYIGRGTPEQWVGDLRLGSFADRLSDHRFWPNQFRPLLHAAAY